MNKTNNLLGVGVLALAAVCWGCGESSEEERIDSPSADLEWVGVPGGKLKERQLPAFEILRTEVTVAQYKKCVDAGKCLAADVSGFCNYNPDSTARDNHPINCLTQAEAQAFCAWAGGRLPDSGYWEYAARHDGTAIKVSENGFPWGADYPEPCKQANYGFCSGDSAEVGSYPAGDSLLGLKDMGGNVWEWTSTFVEVPAVQAETSALDRAGEDAASGDVGETAAAGTDTGKEQKAYAVIMGGAWNHTIHYKDKASGVEYASVPTVSSSANKGNAATRSNAIGMRCIK